MVDFKSPFDKVNIKCLIHGVFPQSLMSHSRGVGCPICKQSTGEAKVRKFLEDNHIEFKQQYSFKGCKDKNHLIFDFYILSKNLCIEYDGKQHFNSIEFFGDKQGLEGTQRRDLIKNNYCRENNIGLLRISYLQVEEISQILNNYFTL